MKPITQQTAQSELGMLERLPDNMSWFDMSHSYIMTGTMGKLYPILMQETLPGDKWSNCSSEIMLRFLPLYLPIMSRVELFVHYYFVPNRILWPEPSGWESYISQKEDLNWAYINWYLTNEYNLGHWIGLPYFPAYNSGTDIATWPLNALPFSAYYKIYDEYYRNDVLQDEVWFPLEEGDNSTNFTTITMAGLDPETEDTIMWANFPPDYFTSCTPTPQVGDAVQVPIVADNYLDADSVARSGPFRFRLQSDDGQPSNGFSPVSQTSGTLWDLQMNSADVYLDIQETSATIAQLRNAIKMQEYYERLIKSGTRYRDYIKAFYNTDPTPMAIDEPIYLGGGKGVVTISDVMTTAETVDSLDAVVQPTGSYRGKALQLSKSNSWSYNCNEHGWIVGILCIMPEKIYRGGVHRKFLRSTPFDYALDMFSNIGDQEVTRIEYNMQTLSASSADNANTWGYQRRFQEYKQELKQIAGQMQYEYLNYHMAAYTYPALLDGISGGVLSVKNQIYPHYVFQMASGDHEIFGHIWHELHVGRKLQKWATPGI